MIPRKTADLEVWGLVFTTACKPLGMPSALVQPVMGSAWEWERKGVFWTSSAGSSEVWDCSLMQCLTAESQENCKPGLQKP